VKNNGGLVVLGLVAIGAAYYFLIYKKGVRGVPTGGGLSLLQDAAAQIRAGMGTAISSSPLDAYFGVANINNTLDPTGAAVPGFSQGPPGGGYT
jgi:hypothetical protein